VKPKPLNAYIWEPRDKHNFGHLGFTATRAACLEILRVAESLASDPRKHEFALPETTIEDLKHIGDRMKMHYRALTIGPAREDGPLVQFKLDQARLHVRLSVPPSALKEFTAMLTEVADDSGDQSFDVEIDGKMADVFYWPCFGHIYKSGEPQNRFPE
jgi:hypothetical protein